MKRLLVFSGAGLSAESGIPTFRDANGLWQNFDVNKVANFETFRENKEMVFDFYNARRREMMGVNPNIAHQVLADLQADFGPERVKLFTQNIDDLLERAGAIKVNHVHGFIYNGQCLSCGHHWDIVEHDDAHDLNIGDLCPRCQSDDLKPGVVMFNEHAPEYETLYKAFKDVEVDENDIVLVIGTNGQVVGPEWIIKNKAFKILVTLDPGMFNPFRFDEFYKQKAGSVLPRLNTFLRKHLGE